MVDGGKGVDAAIRLVAADRNSLRVDIEYRKRDRLKVSKVRYMEDGGFRFD